MPAAPAATRTVRVTEECTGCEVCVTAFECPAIVWDEGAGKAGIVRGACSDCGVCVEVCPMQAIVVDGDVL
jgi:indolepyruvate ferredoxin oxidoreductase alpha subunit